MLLCAVLAGACGKKGPPLPPLIKLPVAPADVTASRRGDTVDLQMTVPTTNTDTSRPANVSRIEVYAFTGAPTVSDADVLRRGTRVASFAVKAPRDPDATTDPDDPDQLDADVDAPEGEGLDQGVAARVREMLTASVRAPTDGATAAQAENIDGNRPLLGPQSARTAARIYVAVGITPKGRRGQASKRVVVPLTPSPAAPVAPKVTYTETEVTVSWPAAGAAAVQAPPVRGILPARLIGVTVPRVAYHVYEVPPPVGSGPVVAASNLSTPAAPDTRLTMTPLAESVFVDMRLTWGERRCYAVRAVEIVDALAVESDATAPVCVTFVDTFPPAAPKGLNAVASGDGAIDLIWDSNAEADLEGYIVLRGVLPGTAMVPITPVPIHETTFRDSVKAGTRYVYALQAVDKAGNKSPVSVRQEETAR